VNGVLPDTSVWILFFRKSADPSVKKLLIQALTEGRVHLSPLVLAELIQGARSDREAGLLKTNLLALPAAPGGADVWLRAGELGQKLRRKGQTVPLTDLAIAASAETGGLELWHADRHFEAIASVSKVRLRAFYP
jgi:predicted nucleic acid-binding protein